MDLFTINPKICYFDTFAEFAGDFSIGKNDLLLTEEVLYNAYIKQLNPQCHVVLKDKYDTGEPREETVDSILQDIAALAFDRIIAVGGGSVIDIAKMLMLKDAYPIARVVNGETPLVVEKELVAVPTTCGTGSEVTFGSIIKTKDGLKTGVIHESLGTHYAVLIPELLSGLPQKVFFLCSMDALCHLMEGYVSATRTNPFVQAISHKGTQMILSGHAQLIKKGAGERKTLNKDFIIASCMGGISVNNGGAGPVHALAYPLGEKYKVSHGESIYQFLVPVMQFYYQQNPGGRLLNELMDVVGDALTTAGYAPASRDDVFSKMGEMLEDACPVPKLSTYGMTKEDVTTFTKSIFESKQRLIVASYVPFKEEDAVRIYTEKL